MRARLTRRGIDALLIGVALLLVLAVGADLGRRARMTARMRIDRHALRVYMTPRFVDPHLMRISVRGAQDLVCAPQPPRRRHHRPVCVYVVHKTPGSWRVIADSGRAAAPARRRPLDN